MWEYWAAVVRPGRVLFEIAGVPDDVAQEALNLAAFKLRDSNPDHQPHRVWWRGRRVGMRATDFRAITSEDLQYSPAGNPSRVVQPAPAMVRW